MGVMWTVKAATQQGRWLTKAECYVWLHIVGVARMLLAWPVDAPGTSVATMQKWMAGRQLNHRFSERVRQNHIVADPAALNKSLRY